MLGAVVRKFTINSGYSTAAGNNGKAIIFDGRGMCINDGAKNKRMGHNTLDGKLINFLQYRFTGVVNAMSAMVGGGYLLTTQSNGVFKELGGKYEQVVASLANVNQYFVWGKNGPYNHNKSSTNVFAYDDAAKIMRLCNVKGDFLQSIVYPSAVDCRMLASDGKYVYVGDSAAKKFRQYSPVIGKEVNAIPIPEGLTPTGSNDAITCDGHYLYFMYNATNTVYQMSLN